MYKLLVIDDSETNTLLIKSLFEDESDEITVYIETNSKNAVDTVVEVMPSLILLDLMMPGIDGEEILRELKKMDSVKDIPVVVISAKQEAEDIQKVLDLGAFEYIKKTFL